MPLTPDQLAGLTALVGSGGVRHAADLAGLDPGVDPHNFGAGLMLRPASTAEVARILAYCHAARIGVVPQGGRTGLAGGAVSAPGQVILSLDRLQRIESLDPVSRTAVVEAGVTLAALAEQAGAAGLSPGIDLGARGSATIGGLVATNAGGLAAFRLGTMRERVLGLEAVLADGTVLTSLTEVRKHNEGLPLEQLFIGAEGTLGVVTRVALALVPLDGPAATALVSVPDAGGAVALCDAVLRLRTVTPAAIELMSARHFAATRRALGSTEFAALATAPYVVLVEVAAATAEAAEAGLVEALGAALEGGIAREATLAQSEAQRQTMWRLREDWAVDRERPGGLWYDVSVPLARLPGYLDSLAAALAGHDPSLDLVVIGHLADGNVHVTINAERPLTDRYAEIEPLVTRGLAAIGGSYSAEHGIGLEKRASLGRLASPGRLALMRRCKQAFDPHGILNPGKVLPD